MDPKVEEFWLRCAKDTSVPPTLLSALQWALDECRRADQEIEVARSLGFEPPASSSPPVRR